MESRPDDRKPHILHVIPTLGSGGAERLLVTYLSNPALRDGFRHTIVLTDVSEFDVTDPQVHYGEEASGLGVEFICLGFPGRPNVRRCTKALRRVIRERKPDLVHTHLLWANIAGRIASRLERVPVISSFHNTDYETSRIRSFGISRLKSSVIRWLDYVTAQLCLTHSVAVSETVSRHIQYHLGLKPETITVILNPFSFEQVTPTCEDPRKKVFEIVGLSPNDRLILTVGRMLEQKSHLELVQAMAQVVSRIPSAHLVIIGSLIDRAYVAKVRQAIDTLGVGSNVHLLVPRHDIPDFLAGSDMFVFPSKFEGLGIALIEAMACELPVVCSDIEVLGEVVKDGETGLIVPVDGVDALAQAIVKILEDPHLAKRLGGQAKIYVYENFHPDRKAEAMACLYKNILYDNRT